MKQRWRKRTEKNEGKEKRLYLQEEDKEVRSENNIKMKIIPNDL